MQGILSRRERERLMRRRAMLEAARAVFAERGYTHATLEEIAQRAEFGKGTLYNYFEGGKEELLFSIFDEIYDDLHRLIDESFAQAVEADRPFRDVFQGFVEAVFTFFAERQDLFMLLIKETHRMLFSDDRARAAYFKRQQERIVQALVPPLEAAMERGTIRTFSAHAVAHMIMGNLHGFQTHLCMEGRDETCRDPAIHSPQEAARFLTTLLLDGLQHRPDPRSATN